MTYLMLFLAFLRVGFFSFGGGLAALPLIEREIVDTYRWLSKPEFLELLALSQLTPGPIAINAATFTGFKVGGMLGAFVATGAFCLPSVFLTLLVVTFLSRFRENPYVAGFLRGLRPALLALLLRVALSVIQDGIHDWFGLLLSITGGALLFFGKIEEIPLLLCGGILGLLWYGWR
ncbi:chromate transporter [Candidatus Caldatribacterium sp. SIUC1]|uniref:chromate transporter n=1 Tax=Candidatus Caldatribacterium sp. SIUC1 TaxID=3418365 RepID=UPI003F68E500